MCGIKTRPQKMKGSIFMSQEPIAYRKYYYLQDKNREK